MSSIATVPTLLTLLLQAPQAEEPRPVLDVIELQSGARLEGEIVEELEDYVQVRLGPRTVVGFERSKIASIARGKGRRAPAAPPAALEPRDEWFVLHDAEGRVVGRMHATVLQDDEGRVRVGEEWQFRGPSETTEVTLLEIVGRDLAPVSSFCHERQRRNVDGRVVKERLVRGTVEGDRFVVDHKSSRERQRTSYPLDPDLRLPLSLLQDLRQRAARPFSETFLVFDPRTGEFRRRAFSSVSRTVQWRDRVVRVSEVHHGDGRQNAEWLDASSKTLRREVNGPSLVAVPAPAAMTERYLMSTEPVFERAVAVEPDSRFALWLPHPGWKVEDPARPGRVLVQDPVHRASACLVAFDQVDPGVHVESAADAAVRWLRLASGLEVTRRERVSVRGREAVRLDATHVEHRGGPATLFRTETYVFAADAGYVALCFAAPKVRFEELRGDFTRLLHSVDLYPGAPPEEAAEARRTARLQR